MTHPMPAGPRDLARRALGVAAHYTCDDAAIHLDPQCSLTIGPVEQVTDDDAGLDRLGERTPCLFCANELSGDLTLMRLVGATHDLMTPDPFTQQARAAASVSTLSSLAEVLDECETRSDSYDLGIHQAGVALRDLLASLRPTRTADLALVVTETAHARSLPVGDFYQLAISPHLNVANPLRPLQATTIATATRAAALDGVVLDQVVLPAPLTSTERAVLAATWQPGMPLAQCVTAAQAASR